MNLTERTVTEISCHMDGSSVDDETFSLSMSKNVVRGYAYLYAAMGRENKVQAIKHCRAEFKLGLRAAKAFVDTAIRYNMDGC